MPLFYLEAVSEDPLTSTATSLAYVLSQLAVSAIGVWCCYIANGGRTGRRFAERFLALGWVVGVRLFLVVAPAFVLILVLEIELATPWLEATMLVLSIVYFWRIRTHLIWVAQHDENAA
jgi:hypothetical protein